MKGIKTAGESAKSSDPQHTQEEANRCRANAARTNSFLNSIHTPRTRSLSPYSNDLSEILLVVDRRANRAFSHRKLAHKRSGPAYRTTEAKTGMQFRPYSHDQTVIIQCVQQDVSLFLRLAANTRSLSRKASSIAGINSVMGSSLP